MKVMCCPLNGPRNINEFIYGGEVEPIINPDTLTDTQWANQLFLRDNQPGTVKEWWMHSASGYWFIAERHRGSNAITATYDSSKLFTHRVNY